MNEKQIFSAGFSDFVRPSLYSTYFTWDLVNAVPNMRVQSLHLFFLQPKLPEPGTEYYDDDQTPNHIPANLNKRAQSRRHRPAHVQEVLRKRLHLGDAGVVEGAERAEVVQRIPVQS